MPRGGDDELTSGTVARGAEAGAAAMESESLGESELGRMAAAVGLDTAYLVALVRHVEVSRLVVITTRANN